MIINQAMECHPVGMQVDVLLKAISDMISQEFKSMRQDMRKEFVKMQESMEDVISTRLAEIKKTETMNNAMPVEETSQTTIVNSDISRKIEEVYSEKAPVFPLVEVIKQEPLLLEEYEVSQTEIDDRNIYMLNKFLPQSDIGVNATVEIVKPQSCVARNSDEECSDSVEMFLNKSTSSETINACKVDAQFPVGINKERHFSCNFCEKSFKRKRNLKVHIRTHTGEQPYQCNVCHKSFSINNTLKTHKRTHTKERPYQCNVCHKSYSKSSNLTIHLRTHTGERPYQCQICHKSFITSGNMQTHMRTHTGERPYQCDVCHNSFSDSSNLNRHLRNHTRERPYQCHVCHKSFAQCGNLKAHIRTHTGERPYQCDVCHKSFSDGSSLNRHLRIHTGERPYQCNVCHKSFAQSNHLKTHMRIHAGVRPYQCEVCHMSFSLSSQLKTHMTNHTGEQL